MVPVANGDTLPTLGLGNDRLSGSLSLVPASVPASEEASIMAFAFTGTYGEIFSGNRCFFPIKIRGTYIK